MDHRQIKGNRLVLVGVIWYLLEFVAIGFAYQPPPSATSPGADLMAYYAANRSNIPVYVVGVCTAILGRLAFFAGLRSALSAEDHDAERPWLDLAFALAIVSVAVEMVSVGMVGVALGVASSGAETHAVLAAALHNSASAIAGLVGLPFALAVALGSFVMLRRPGLPRWIGWVGLIGGIGASIDYALAALGARMYPAAVWEWIDLAQFAGWLAIVIWMLAIGIVLFKRAGESPEPTRQTR